MNRFLETYGFLLIAMLACMSVSYAQSENNISIKYEDITDSTICINGEWHKLKIGSVSQRRYYVDNTGLKVYIEEKPKFPSNIPTQDVIYLLNGSIIRGIVIEQVFNSHVKIQTKDGSVFVYKNDEIDKILKEQDYSRQRSENLKDPAVAFLLSFCITGAGQYYNGEYGKGLMQQSLVGTGVIMVLAGGFKEEEHHVYNVEPKLEPTSWLYAGISLISIAQLWSLADAPMSAASINKRNSERKYGMQIAPCHDGVKTSLCVNF
jgi:hypothetical protein